MIYSSHGNKGQEETQVLDYWSNVSTYIHTHTNMYTHTHTGGKMKAKHRKEESSDVSSSSSEESSSSETESSEGESFHLYSLVSVRKTIVQSYLVVDLLF